MGRRPRIFVVSGPAGVGKGTLVSRVRAMRPFIGLPVSATTRKPRPGEVDGVSYHFMTDADFMARVEKGDFLEWAQVHTNKYGTLKSEINACLDRGESVVLEIDVQGGFNVRRVYPDAVLVFIEPPSWEVLEERLRGRGTETSESLSIRLSNAKKELQIANSYDVRIVNDDLDEAVRDLERTFETYESE